MRRLILFDIDGTLLSTNLAAKRAFHRAMLDVYGAAGPIETHRFDGKTDPQIARELLVLAGFAGADIEAGFDRLWSAYVLELEREIAAPHSRVTVYPGVQGLLAALHAHEANPLLGLLTGNIQPGAALKLRAAQIPDHFRVGAFGSDAERRDELPAIAVERAHEHSGVHFRGRDIVVIGDTPADIACGQSLGVRAIGVATGHHSIDDLMACGADAAFQDFSDVQKVLQSIMDH
jgi:phosphoglycolate phosphatase-like HAD superfamily hydrolase